MRWSAGNKAALHELNGINAVGVSIAAVEMAASHNPPTRGRP